MEKNGIVQTEHGLIFRKDKPIQMLPKEFEGIRLFSPLTALMYGQEGYESDEPEEITPTQLCRYVSAIKKQLIKEQLDTEGDRGLAEKPISMVWQANVSVSVTPEQQQL